MNNLYTTDNVEKQRKEMDRKLANHYNANNCDGMEKPLVWISRVLHKQRWCNNGVSRSN